MRYIKYSFLPLILTALLASAGGAKAGEAKPEIHIYGDGKIHLIGADLFRKHALNQYTVKIWGIMWRVPIDLLDTKIKFESAYGAAINPSEIKESDELEIRGQISFNKSALENQIEPMLIRDLNIKTGEPPAPTFVPTPAERPLSAPTPAPTQIGEPLPSPTAATMPKSQPQTAQTIFTRYLKYKSDGEDVARLQSFLKKQGFLPKSYQSSGYFGLATEKALMNFQKANAIDALGTLGPKTRALINSLIRQ